MSLEIMRDPRIRSVHWQDLTKLSRFEVLKEVFISSPWLIGSLVLAHYHWYIPALVCSFMFFLTGLRQVHNAYHYAFGLSRATTEWVIYVLSVLMLGSMHAIQTTHLHHHKHCMDEEEDVEASSALMPWWKALWLGPTFPVRLHIKALQIASKKQRRWIIFELCSNVVWIAMVFTIPQLSFMKYQIVVMAVGQCYTAFFAVWTVHHDCDRSHFIARTMRSTYKRLMSYEMFYHLEHHLYPKVPTCHLHLLAERLDEVAPELQQKRVF